MSRLVLGFDTATEAVAVALGSWPDAGREGEPVLLGEGDVVAPRASLSRLLPIVDELLLAQGAVTRDIDLVVVGRGPGSYTGVRIGMAAAKGLAQGLGVPLLGVGTLDAVAWGLRAHEGLLGVVGDAMRQEVYPALFEVASGDVRRLGPDVVADPAAVASAWADLDVPLSLAGDGLRKHLPAFLAALGDGATVTAQDVWLPSGRGVLDAGWASAGEGEGDPGVALPVYTRLSDAEHVEPGRGADVPPEGVAGPVGGER